jgi:hypothetical protein
MIMNHDSMIKVEKLQKLFKISFSYIQNNKVLLKMFYRVPTVLENPGKSLNLLKKIQAWKVLGIFFQ